MADKSGVAMTMKRMKDTRRHLVKDYPFFGELIMNLNLAVADVGTACTDGKHLIMDSNFVERLSVRELEFVYMHEVMHVVFFHCYRRNGRNKYLWNIACDLVVNSNIVMAMGVDDLLVDDEYVLHRINGFEAYHYTAEEIYNLLLCDGVDSDYSDSQGIDSHEIWEEIAEDEKREAMDRWNELSLEATSKWYGTGVGIAAGSLKRYKDALYRAQLKWKQIVRDFVRYRNNEQDYGFRPPDRRFAEEEFIYPGLNDVEEAVVEGIWIFIDKSGSMSVKMIMDIVHEIECGLQQVGHMKAMVSFFDTNVTTPISIEQLKDFVKVKVPMPDGGTSFHSIFQYAVRNRKKYMPRAIIVLTDGYAVFPDKNPMKDVDVLWIIVNNPNAKHTFGKKINISSV